MTDNPGNERSLAGRSLVALRRSATVVCQICGTAFDTQRPQVAKFCGSLCKSREQARLRLAQRHAAKAHKA